jgi:peptidoglycan/xylan/chitin deacetylase (PgdA/CDA1 family)
MPILATLLLGLHAMPTLADPVVLPFAGGKKAAFSLEFDDSMVSQIKNVLPLLAEYKFPATFYINPGRNDYDAGVWEKQVPAAGHELADHTLHHGDTVGAEQGEKEIGSVAKIIEKVYGGPRLTVFGTPGGVKWEIPKDDFERILKENRLVFPGRMDFYQDGQGDITRFPQTALDKGIWRQLGFHGVGGQWLSTSVENLTFVLKFLDAHRDQIWVAPTGTVWKYMREREALHHMSAVPHGKEITLTPSFDQTKLKPFELYNEPLTIQVPVPASWKGARYSVDGRKHWKTATKVALGMLIEVAPQVRSVIVERV